MASRLFGQILNLGSVDMLFFNLTCKETNITEYRMSSLLTVMRTCTVPLSLMLSVLCSCFSPCEPAATHEARLLLSEIILSCIFVSAPRPPVEC